MISIPPLPPTTTTQHQHTNHNSHARVGVDVVVPCGRVQHDIVDHQRPLKGEALEAERVGDAVTGDLGLEPLTLQGLRVRVFDLVPLLIELVVLLRRELVLRVEADLEELGRGKERGVLVR